MPEEDVSVNVDPAVLIDGPVTPHAARDILPERTKDCAIVRFVAFHVPIVAAPICSNRLVVELIAWLVPVLMPAEAVRRPVTPTVPVKLDALDIVCPLINPDVMAPELRFRLDPVAAPMFGVTSVGVFAKTNAPVPVSSVTAAIRFALDGVPKNVATFVPSPDTPVEIGNPVAFVRVPDVGVPRIGVVNVGLVAKTRAPDPVSSVTAAAKLELEGVARNVAIPVPSPLIAEEIGMFVNVFDAPDIVFPVNV